MARKFKTIEVTIKYQIYDDEKEILDKYGYDYKRNAEDEAEKNAKYVAATLRKCEEEIKNQIHQRITSKTESTTMTKPIGPSCLSEVPTGHASMTPR